MTDKSKKTWIVGVLVVVLALGVMAFAPRITASADSGWYGEGDDDPPPGNHDEALAEALGITVEELRDAYQAAHQAAIQQAVDEGKLTQEQADRMLNIEEDGRLGRGRHFGGPSPEGDFLADALGITAEELQAAQEQARAALVEQALADGTLTQEQVDLRAARNAVTPYFQEAMKSAYQSAVEQALADGVITQEQADQLLENAGEGFGPRGFDGGPFGGGFHPDR